MPEIEIGELRADELAAAGDLLARAYRDNPWMVALLGDDPAVREEVLRTAQRFRISPLQPPAVVARRDGALVGVCGFDPPVRASRSPEEQARLFEVASQAGPDVFARLVEIMGEFERRAPAEPHWHLGPVGVDVNAQRQGIGSRMLERFCAMLDESGEIAFLETEVPENVPLYEKFGFATVEQASILGVPGWFMLRRPVT